MAEAGPSSSVGTPSSSFASTSSAPTAHARHSRLQFPGGDQDALRARAARAEGAGPPPRVASFGLGQTLPSRRAGAALGGGNGSSSGQAEEFRRRVKSVDAAEPPMGASRIARSYEQEAEVHKRTMSMARRPAGKGKGPALMDVAVEHTAVPFSDEYDLSHEDPRILEDVQRALKLKARREARLKAVQTNLAAKDAPLASDQTSNSSFSTYSSPVRTKLAELPQAPPPLSTHTTESEIDFSPSVGSVPLHPVPSSSNGGATLDWTGSASEDERDKRWSLSISKRKHKDKTSFYATRSVVDKQETLYVDKLARIKAKAKPHTLRKASITAEQLQRRYAALLAPNKGGKTPVTLLGAARWYSKQEPVVQTSLDNTEPLTWLKHLLEKRGKRSARLPWHLSAMIIEEYAKSLVRPEPMQTIPEDGATSHGTAHTAESSPYVISVVSPDSKPASKTPSSGSWSWSPPPQTLEPSLSRKRRPSKDDAPVSFEPQVDSGKESPGPESGRSSLEPVAKETPAKPHNTVYSTDSTRSSAHSSLFSASRGFAMSPASSRLQFRDFAKRMRRKQLNGSEDGLSSARNSLSEHSHEDDMGSPKRKPRSRPMSLQLKSPNDGTMSEGDRAAALSLSDRGFSDGGEGPMTAKQGTPAMPMAELTARPDGRPMDYTPLNLSPATRAKDFAARKRRMSLPSLDNLLMQEKERRRQQADEEAERQEYEHKAQLHDDTQAQNHRTRQLLQRVGANLREYENVQSRLAHLRGTTHTPIPQDVLDAFSHDPASVTAGTRRFKSWRAVEDIHERINRQRDTLLNFVASINENEDEGDQFSIFDEPIGSLSASLEELEQRRQDIARKAEEVAEALISAKDIHANVKKEYNDVLAHTSLIYPELSHIVALEESYRNKYQQFWDIGLDALTLLLDTVTPVWRNYGKVIGEDVQDFLIIPWYRNEFTGEAQRYPIAHLPRRSLRHWFGLLLFGFTSCGLALLQLGAAVSSTMNANLPWIAHTGFRWVVIPFFAVGLVIQWSAVLVECSIVFAELAVVLWWLGWAVRVFH